MNNNEKTVNTAPSCDAKPTVTIRGLSKSFGSRQILHNINLDVLGGEIFGFLGPNGSGKTTTIKLMLGLLRIDEGEICICSHNVKKDFEAAIANVGGIVENPEMYRYLTGRQMLEQYRRMYNGVPRERIDEVTRTVGLEGRIDDKISKYSLGMRQRLGLAQAILASPKLLVLDEPTNGLDPMGIHDLRDILLHLSHDEGVSVFISSHQLAELELMCDRVGVLDHGVLLGIRSMDELHRIGGESTDICELTVLDRAAAEAVFAGRGTVYTATDAGFRVTVPAGGIPDLLRAVCDSGAGLCSAVPASRSLEDAFLEMTRSYTVPGGGESK